MIWALEEAGGTGRVLVHIIMCFASIDQLLGLSCVAALGALNWVKSRRPLWGLLKKFTTVTQLAVFNLLWVLPRMQLA